MVALRVHHRSSSRIISNFLRTLPAEVRFVIGVICFIVFIVGLVLFFKAKGDEDLRKKSCAILVLSGCLFVINLCAI